MKRLGKVLHVSKAKRLILNVETNLPVGAQVCDSKLRPVGLVADIFGPVKKPYVSVRSSVDTPEQYVGQILYAI